MNAIYIHSRVLTPPPPPPSLNYTPFSPDCIGGKTSEPSNDRNLSSAPCILFKQISMPRLDKCVPLHLNKFISRARMLQWRITQPPKLNTRFLTRKLTRLRTLSIALPSVALCQYLLCNISDYIILTSGSNVRRRSKPHSISVNNCQLFVKPRSLEPS